MFNEVLKNLTFYPIPTYQKVGYIKITSCHQIFVFSQLWKKLVYAKIWGQPRFGEKWGLWKFKYNPT